MECIAWIKRIVRILSFVSVVMYGIQVKICIYDAWLFLSLRM